MRSPAPQRRRRTGLTGELAAFLLESITAGLGPGVEGWVDDDFAFLAPWGFDVKAIQVPVLDADRLEGAGRSRGRR